MQFHFEFPTLVERLGENMSKHAHEKDFFQKKISEMWWDLNPGLWFHSLTLYQLSHWTCWYIERFFVYLNPFWDAFALLKECMHCRKLCSFLNFWQLDMKRCVIFRLRSMHLKMWTEKRNLERVGFELRSADLLSNTLPTELSDTRLKGAEEKRMTLIWEVL